MARPRREGVQVVIGERRRPQPFGQPGWVRVDTVHQGDLDGIKGLYHVQPRRDRVQAAGARCSMDGRGRCLDNVFIERLWRSLKYEAVYLHELADGFAAEQVISVEHIHAACLAPVLDALLRAFPFTLHGFRSLTGSSTIPFHRGGRCFVRLLLSRSLTGSSTVPVHREGGSRQRMSGRTVDLPACGRPLTVALNPEGGEAGAQGLHIDAFTKSRARRSTDNALVDTTSYQRRRGTTPLPTRPVQVVIGERRRPQPFDNLAGCGSIPSIKATCSRASTT